MWLMLRKARVCREGRRGMEKGWSAMVKGVVTETLQAHDVVAVKL